MPPFIATIAASVAAALAADIVRPLLAALPRRPAPPVEVPRPPDRPFVLPPGRVTPVPRPAPPPTINRRR